MVAFVTLIDTHTPYCYLHCYGPQWACASMGLNAGRLGAGGRRFLLMSSEENKEIALSLLEALNARDLSVWSQHLAEGDHVLIHWTASGTHAERLATITGETIPPTRRRVRVSGALLTEVRDGKIVREWIYWDQLSLLAQLGITDQPGRFVSPEGF